MSLSDNSAFENDDPILFYADPVDEDGDVIATVDMTITHSSGFSKPVRAVKVPASEIPLDPKNTIHARLGDDDA